MLPPVIIRKSTRGATPTEITLIKEVPRHPVVIMLVGGKKRKWNSDRTFFYISLIKLQKRYSNTSFLFPGCC